jgi:hypothetical protein
MPRHLHTLALDRLTTVSGGAGLDFSRMHAEGQHAVTRNRGAVGIGALGGAAIGAIGGGPPGAALGAGIGAGITAGTAYLAGAGAEGYFQLRR